MFIIILLDGCYKCFELEVINVIIVGVKFMFDFIFFLIILRGISLVR